MNWAIIRLNIKRFFKGLPPLEGGRAPQKVWSKVGDVPYIKAEETPIKSFMRNVKHVFSFGR